MTKAIYKFYWNCGRMGDLEGVFIADKEKVASAIGKNVYFGEVLGKHSEIYGNLDQEDVTFVTDDPHVIELFELHDLVSGYNPLECMEDFDQDEAEADCD
jgi:hypothetical protein